MPNHVDYLILQLKEIQDTPESYKANESFLRSVSNYAEWKLCEPYPPQWDFWHCVTKGGGVIPFTIEFLIERLEEVRAGDRYVPELVEESRKEDEART